MRRLAPVLPLGLVALVCACGSGAGRPAPKAPDLPEPAALVLHASDAYVAGYSAAFARPAQVGIVRQGMTYRDARAARIVIGDRQAIAHITRRLHAHAIAAPPGAPGTPRLVLAGTPAGLPAYAYGWQRGAALEPDAVFGRHVTLSRVVALARPPGRPPHRRLLAADGRCLAPGGGARHP
jgi:hypothetical protein